MTWSSTSPALARPRSVKSFSLCAAAVFDSMVRSIWCSPYWFGGVGVRLRCQVNAAGSETRGQHHRREMMTSGSSMPAASQLAVYETFESVYGRKSTMDELIAEIRPFTQQSVLWVCAVIVTGMQLWNRVDSQPAD